MFLVEYPQSIHLLSGLAFHGSWPDLLHPRNPIPGPSGSCKAGRPRLESPGCIMDTLANRGMFRLELSSPRIN